MGGMGGLNEGHGFAARLGTGADPLLATCCPATFLSLSLSSRSRSIRSCSAFFFSAKDSEARFSQLHTLAHTLLPTAARGHQTFPESYTSI